MLKVAGCYVFGNICAVMKGLYVKYSSNAVEQVCVTCEVCLVTDIGQ